MEGIPAIVHLDADAFFVSCEQARDPSLVGKKCAVGGTQRGIISSASYEARACGVYTPMPTVRALRVCPDLVMIPHTAGLYGDEGYLDLAPCRLADASAVERAVRSLQSRIWDELRIPVSMGIASNKLVAQIASKLRKPRGFVVVPPGGEAAFLEGLPVGKLPGIGAKTEAALEAEGVRLVRDLLARGETELASLFGQGWRGVVEMARGVDHSRVEVEHDDAKSYSKQETFSLDLLDFEAVEQVAKRMVDELLPKVRADGVKVRTITLRVRYPDFSHEAHGRSLEAATDLEAPFYPLVGPLLRAAWSKRRPLRLVGVRLSGVEDGPEQLQMFAEGEERRRKLADVMDRLNRGGKDSVVVRGHRLGGDRGM